MGTVALPVKSKSPRTWALSAAVIAMVFYEVHERERYCRRLIKKAASQVVMLSSGWI